MLVGDRQVVERARRLRKMLGGGMRQAGVLAACGLYALDHHIERLAEDHAVAAELAQGLDQVLDRRFRVQKPETNILLVHTDGKPTTDAMLRHLEGLGIRALPLADTTVRFVAHLDLPADAAAEAVRRIGEAP
jgi:threonine aldolase